jgi:hypothetical protein
VTAASQDAQWASPSFNGGDARMAQQVMEGALYTRTRDKFEPGAELGQALLAKHT